MYYQQRALWVNRSSCNVVPAGGKTLGTLLVFVLGPLGVKMAHTRVIVVCHDVRMLNQSHFEA